MLTYNMVDGRRTTDVEQYIRWISALCIVPPEMAQGIRDRDRAERALDRTIDAAVDKLGGGLDSAGGVG